MTAGEVDYYGLDELLGEEERMTRASVRTFVEREVLPVIERCHSDEQFPRQLIPRMGELGFFGANLRGYGCAGLSNVAYGLIMQELEAGDSGLRSMASVQGSLAMFAIWRWGSEEQKQRWLPEMARGRAIGCFGLTEPDHGSDPGGMETRARRDGSGYVLSGVKRWITNGSIADVSVVWAKEGENIRGSSRSAPRSPPSWCWRTCACRPRRCCPAPRASPARSRASTRRATGSCGARSARRAPAT